MLSRFLVLSFIIIFSAATINAQYIEDHSTGDFLSLTIENGLSQNTVHCILKDRSGYLWFGTDDGISRYNSYDITVFKGRQGGSKILSGVTVFDLFEDKKDKLWIAGDNGLSQYDPVTETVRKLSLFKNPRGRIRVNCIYPENDSLLWLGTSNGLLLYNHQQKILKHYKHAASDIHSLSNSDVLSLAKDGDMLWVGTHHGLNLLDINTGNATHYFHKDEDPYSPGGNVIMTLSINEAGELWVGTETGGISYHARGSQRFINYNSKNSDLPNNYVKDICYTQEGDIWIATNGGGLSKMHQQSGAFTTFDHNPDNMRGLVSNSVYSVFEDREGILWVGTYAAGICFNTSKNNVFKIIRHQPHDSNSVCASRIRSLFLDGKDRLWLGTWGGLSVYDQRDKTYASYACQKNNSSSLSFNTVTAVFEDSEANLWVGTYSGGLNLMKPDRQGFVHYKSNPRDINSLSNDNVYCIAEDSKTNLWVGTLAGLNLYNRVTNDFKRFGGLGIRDIVVTKDDNLILATGGGVLFFNPSTETFEHFYSPKLTSFTVNKLMLEEDGKSVWVCSEGGGLALLDLNNRKYTIFTEEDGLSSNFVASIEADGEDIFWISTFKGLSKFNKKTKTFENFGLEEKLPCYQFQPKASVQLPDGTIGFGGSKGLVVFHPDSIGTSRKNPKIMLSSLKIDNKVVTVNGPNSPLRQSISETEKLSLKYGQNDFSIDFAALNFNNPGMNQYAYILENYMDEWAYIGNTTTVGFTNLNHGEYVLRIKTTNNTSGENEKFLGIVIAPPFYATWWFKILIALAIALLFYSYKKYTLISIKQKNDLTLQRMKLKSDEEFSQMRLRFFTYISHELRTPLTLISDPLHQLMENKRDTKDMRILNLIDKSVSRLLRLIDQVLDIKKFEGDTLSLQVAKQDILKRVEETVGAFYEFALQKEIAFKFQTDMDNLEGWVDEDKIEKIMYNLLSNAMKFTQEKGEVTVTLSQERDNAIIQVKDSGIGIAKDQLSKIFDGFYRVKTAKTQTSIGNGIGLAYVKRLVELHHATISVDSTLGTGSTFTVTIPINKEAYQAKEIAEDSAKMPATPAAEINDNGMGKVCLKQHAKDTPRILVVEDETDIRNYIVESLSKKFRIIQASNGKEGLFKALKYLPDLILSDTLMPIMDGIELCQQIKSNDKTSHIPFVFLSAWTSDNFKVKGLEIGANDYIKKPFSIKILESKIVNIVENGKKISEISKRKISLIPDDKSIDSFDSQFIRKTQEVLERNFDDPDFNAYTFRKEMNMSHSVLYRKLKQLTGKSSNEFIRSYRLKRAAQIIKQNSGLLIAEVCIKSGFNDPKYFSQCFKREYKLTPSEYAIKYASEEQTLSMP
ncbi:two-component regulator propeller domain-containing protein [Fulvivirgaceae bacterium BMA12]|uniref:histidine kinase n=1 Tax=Agaribacillus aureus TaxID=3051825 RepID=A0ABT8L7H0_9BACT|nr:two-component regulator propeller domain-containing protein [Fulvivirgaceae bacterium BMA12]